MPHQDELLLFLTAVRRRWFADEALRTVARAAAAASLATGAGLGIFWILAPGGALLVGLVAATLLAVAASAAVAGLGMQRRPDTVRVARFVEERAAALPGVGPLDDTLVTAVEPGATPDPALRPLLHLAAARRIEALAPSDIVPAATLRRRALKASAALAVLTVFTILAVEPFERALDAARLIFLPSAIRVDVTPGDVKVRAGSPVEIRAVVRAGGRLLTRDVPRLTVTAGDDTRTVPMRADGDGFAFTFESVDRTFRYIVSLGRPASAEYTVTALFAPEIERIELRYEYPAFTGLRPREEEDGGDIYAPAGTRVRVRVHADKPLLAGAMTLGSGDRQALQVAGERMLEGELVLARDDSYRVSLADQDGFRADGGTEYFIRLMDDRPPDVRILRPAGDQQITPLEEVTIEARAEDDYGIAKLELVYAVPGGPTRTVPFSRTSGTDVTRLGSHLLAAEELDVKPGDVITYYARARDIARGKQSTEARSDMYFLEVRPFGEEFVAAESQAGGGASSQQIESLIAAQKEIISATWNVERRAGAGRSAADVQAIAQAQAELKARAEQMTARRLRSRDPLPQRVQPPQPAPARPPGGDPVAAAIQAMGRALEQLQSERTREALPHEMAALRGLLQAQAEIRRREVMQQQASGASSGGAGRQGEDLSALFDKELQRQQRTNYETRSQVEERPDQGNQESALERIRDLARRQEEITRRLRELSELSEEERKRQLERLTREQMELREQVEELARRSGSDGREGRSSSPATQSQQAAQHSERTAREEEAKEAANHMRTAGDLTRRDPRAAADEAQKAAERLREIEQGMRADSPQARQRAAGDLQLEAQQIAAEQRRIAAEASRLDRGEGGGNADARRRLAGEKEQLADRVDALERAAGELAKSEEGNRFADVARELAREQIGRRMRETAKSLRNGPSGAAAAEDQLAAAMDRIVRQLGSGQPDGREPAAQLEQTRAIGDRLDRLERQIAEAEARQKAGRGRQTGADVPKSSADATTELQRLREEYARELQQAREALTRMRQSAPQTGLGGTTPEKHEWSQADPGTQGFKQDFTAWDSLRKEINLAIERAEMGASTRRAHDAARDRLSAGGSERVPDAYRRLIARYYESLARAKK